MHREIAKQLIETPQWPLLMRHTFIDSDSGKKTTPFREMIRKMPGIYFLYNSIIRAGGCMVLNLHD